MHLGWWIMICSLTWWLVVLHSCCCESVVRLFRPQYKTSFSCFYAQAVLRCGKHQKLQVNCFSTKTDKEKMMFRETLRPLFSSQPLCFYSHSLNPFFYHTACNWSINFLTPTQTVEVEHLHFSKSGSVYHWFTTDNYSQTCISLLSL